TLTKQWLMEDFGSDFSLRDTGELPLTLQPGWKHLFMFCYTPHADQIDSAKFLWGTTLQPPFQHSNKDFSFLFGGGVKSGFVWDRTIQDFNLDTTRADSETVRVFLFNNSSPGGPPAHVDSVFITGPDASEFAIVG